MAAQRHLTVLRERRLAALITAILARCAVVVVTALQRPAYEASASIFMRADVGSSVADGSAAAHYASQQITTCKDLVETLRALDELIGSLGLTTSARLLASHLSAAAPGSTLLITVTARASTPEDSAELAKAVSESLRSDVAELEAPKGQTTVELNVVTPVHRPKAPKAETRSQDDPPFVAPGNPAPEQSEPWPRSFLGERSRR